jgi:uncharacterized protein YuzE
MGAIKTKVRYYPAEDILRVEFGSPRAAITIAMGDGGLARLDVKTHELIGLEILNFRERLEAQALPSWPLPLVSQTETHNGDKPSIPQALYCT